MGVKAALTLADVLVFADTGKHLNDLQRTIFLQVWQGKKYLEIAEEYGYTEGHLKDVAYQLWKLLSKALGERVTKSNCRTVIERRLQSESMAKILPHSISSRSNFIGRDNAIAYLNTLVQQGSKVIVIQGEGGIGKTTLAQQYLNNQDFELVLELLMAKETTNITSVARVVEEWLKKDFNEEPGREFGVTLGRLKRHLDNRYIGILIDNLEPALDKDGMLISSHRAYVELLRVLSDAQVQSVTLITSRDRFCEPNINVIHYRLPGLDKKAWETFFHLRDIESDQSILSKINKTYGGNAKAMGIISGVIGEDFAGDMNTYWQENYNNPLIERDLKNLIATQFERLQNLDIEAYHLLCRLGCYRYQDIPSVSKSGLLWLLWDVEIDRRNSIIESLRNRSLVEFSKGQYWLHPVIQAEAIARLRLSQEWKIVHQKIAIFWTESVQKVTTVSDAIMALEAYYHYIEIEDFQEAGQIILKSRNNQWGQFLPLGSTLYRLGLIQPVLTAITQIIDKIESNNLAELYNILGDLYWITGKIQQAITCQQETISSANKYLDSIQKIKDNQHQIYYLRMLEVDSWLSIGLYKIDLWELEEAGDIFKRVIQLTTNTSHYRWGEKASVCLALINSYLGFHKQASASADLIYQAIVADHLLEHTGRFAYFMQILGQTYTNLREFAKALEMYQRAIAFCQESHHLQVKGKTLTGLAEIYRQQLNFELAYCSHAEAIHILDKIGAKCDLAEAYFQLGLTDKQREKLESSQINFQQAIKLFTEMEAPKQVEKVLTAIENKF